MKIAIYPGSLDPITNGHLDIIERSAMIFDKLIVSISKDNKKTATFRVEEKIKMIEDSVSNFGNVEVSSFDGLLMDYAFDSKALVIIRGLRVLSDFEYEFKMAMMNRYLNDDISTLFLMPHEKYTHISSSLVKEVASHGGNISEYVSPFVLSKMNKKFAIK